MDKTKLLQSYLSNMQVVVSEAWYTKVNMTWKLFDFIPAVKRFYFIVEGEGRLHIDGRTFTRNPDSCF